jgi:small-conductance mechanosensitive channel
MSEIISTFSLSPYLKALAILLISLFAAKTIDIILTKFLKRFARFTETDIDDRIIELIHRPLFFTVLFIGLNLSLTYLGVSKNVMFYSHAILYSIILIIWLIAFMRMSNLLIEHLIKKEPDVVGLKKDIIPFLENLAKITFVVIALMVLFSLWKINITPLVASAGIAGAALAFAAKDTVANIFGGISIFVDKPFKVGDYIILDKGERGEVVNIGIRSTRIKTRDDILITIPNSIIANTKIINESAPVPKFRIRVPVSVAYGSDIDLVERILLEVASENENVLKEPEPRVRFRAFGDSALNFELLCWAKEPALRGRTIHELNSAIYKRFNKEGIRIPFPQRDVHIYRTEL